MNRRTLGLFLLLLTLINIVALGEETPELQTANIQREKVEGRLEEVAMCHHAIKAMHHEALVLDQNAYYRWIIDYMGKGHNIVPIPERCRNFTMSFILAYTQSSDIDKKHLDKSFSDKVGMTISEMAIDVDFLNVVIQKMDIEGSRADLTENENKDVPEPKKQ